MIKLKLEGNGAWPELEPLLKDGTCMHSALGSVYDWRRSCVVVVVPRVIP